MITYVVGIQDGKNINKVTRNRPQAQITVEPPYLKLTYFELLLISK